MAAQPNLLLFITDQQRSDTMACYGNDWIQAPHLNALAKESFVFENTYCAQPVCTPARATLLTGLYPHTAGMIKNNVQLDPAIQSIAEMVSDDYHCAYYGKWHLGNETTCQHGFDKWLPIFELPWVIDHPDTPYHQFLLQNGMEPDHTTAAGHRVFSALFRSNLPEELTHVSYLADEAARFLQSKQHEPFMLQVHCPEPHGPYTGPLNDVHNPNELPVGPTFLEFPEGASLFNRKRAEYYLHADGHKMGKYGPGTSEQQWRQFRAQYYGNVTLIDRALNKVLKALQESGQADNTIVVFGSDHGEMAGDHGMMEKRAFYEESAKVPLMLRVPWLSREHQMIPGNVGHIDLVPTLLDLMGRPVPEHLQGTSRVPVFKGEATLEHNDAFIQWNGIGDRNFGTPLINLLGSIPWRSIVTAEGKQNGSVNRWKLNLCAGDQSELFDLNTDPYEQTNLFNDPTHRDRIREMAAKIRLWQHQTEDTAPLPDV